jgi:competence/damage-inducible protein CinA-like protein
VRVAICSVGAELLAGEIVDTNAAWMARRVLEAGGRMSALLVVGDDRAEIVRALEWLADRSDLILVGGGLGPTSDDLTRYAVADFADADLERRDELVAHLTDVYDRLDREMPADALAQADIPVGAAVHPPLGSAAGFVVDTQRSGRPVRVHVLPGVPWEYQGLAERDVLPDLVGRADGVARVTRVLHVAGAGESWIDNELRDLTDRLTTVDDVELGFLARSEEVQVRITATGATPTVARERATEVLEEASERLGDTVTGVDEQRLEEVVAELLRARGHTVAVVETVSAGRISAALSIRSGAADILRGDLVAGGAGVGALGLSPDGSDGSDGPDGPDGPPSTTELAAAVRERFGADIGLAVTGAAPGDAAPDVEPGTVAWAIVGPGDSHYREQTYIVGDRDIVQARSVAFVLESLRRRLQSTGPA